MKGRNKAGGAPLVLDDAMLGEPAETAEVADAVPAIEGTEPKGGHFE